MGEQDRRVTPPVTHFYHLFSGGQAWRDALAEHLAALEDAQFDGPFHVGIIGPKETREEALYELQVCRPPDSVATADDGWEQVTLDALHTHVQALPPRDRSLVMYAHTKGAWDPSPVNVAWRRSMSWHVVLHWREVARAITNRKVDAAGCHWLTPEQYRGVVSSPFFGGTFWIATSRYLRTLPVCARGTRHDAEMWIGLKRPTVIDLYPGWPGMFPTHIRYRRLIAGRA